MDRINKVVERCGYPERCTGVARHKDVFIGTVYGFKDTKEDHKRAKILAEMINQEYDDLKLSARCFVTVGLAPCVSVRGRDE
jgi:hypothetical protein